MTAERLAQGLRERAPADTDREQDILPAASILAMCDRLLDEVGRRRHMFAWLRVPGATAGEWLAVDAYYPRARLVVMCRSAPDAHDALYRELIPAHGFGLLMLDPTALGDDPDAVRAAVAAKLFDLEHMPEREPDAQPSRASAGRRADPGWTPVKVERMAVAPAVEQGVGMIVGLALAAFLIAEVYLDVVYVFGAGRVMLAFAIALEACSRALGTVAAARAGERAWACACAIIGAPAVLWFALARRSERAEVEPAPLAGLLAGLAGLLGVIALLTGA
jgi:hypothetical protein